MGSTEVQKKAYNKHKIKNHNNTKKTTVTIQKKN